MHVCLMHQVLTLVVLHESTAYICFGSSDQAQLAVRRMSNRPVFGGTEAVQVKLISHCGHVN